MYNDIKKIENNKVSYLKNHFDTELNLDCIHEYNNSGKLLKKILNGNIFEEYTYDYYNRLVQVLHKSSYIETYSYFKDPDGLFTYQGVFTIDQALYFFTECDIIKFYSPRHGIEYALRRKYFVK